MEKQKFIEHANLKHNNYYNYDLIPDIIKSKDKISIICPVHGEFKQRSDIHLFGKGCLKCKGHPISNINEFIKKAKKNHNIELYDFSCTNYINSRTKVQIKCKKHGIFEILPSAFLSYGYDCPKCGVDKMLLKNKEKYNTEYFISRAKLIHGNMYNYELVDYKHSEIKIKIICLKHGVFLQTPHSHLQGAGCPYCNYYSTFSKGEKEVLKYIKEFYNKEILENTRKIITPLELDIYLPEDKIAVEYNGGYWHKLQEQKQPGYHKLKAKLCKEKGIKLINISEYNWVFNKEKSKEKILKVINNTF